MIAALTGHRPQRMSLVQFKSIKQGLIDKAKELRIKGVIMGMAQGFDQWGADALYNEGIPYIAALPFNAPKYPAPEYSRMLSQARRVYVVTPGYYNNQPQKYIIRDKWMVDNAQVIFAAFDGNEYGGTWETIKYARELNKPVYIFDIKEV